MLGKPLPIDPILRSHSTNVVGQASLHIDHNIPQSFGIVCPCSSQAITLQCKSRRSSTQEAHAEQGRTARQSEAGHRGQGVV